jgi:NitT/TauT family transport system permease protein/sulfonate transport system permease protein
MAARHGQVTVSALVQTRGKGRISPKLAAHIFTVCALLAWALASSVLPVYVLPSPIVVGRRVLDLLTVEAYLRHAAFSVVHVVLALAAAFALGLALSALAHYARVTRLMIHARLNGFLNSFSALGWTFLSIIWFGVNDFTVIFAMAAVILPLVIINLREGFLQLDKEVVEMARSFGHRPLRQFRMITLPLLAPYIVATLRITYGVAWIISLTAELFGGSSGFGYVLNRARMEFKIDIIFAIIFIIIFVVYATDRFVWIPLQERMRKHYAGS